MYIVLSLSLSVVVMPATVRLGELMGRIRNSRPSLGTSDVKASLGYVSLGLKKKNHKEGILLIFYGKVKITG